MSKCNSSEAFWGIFYNIGVATLDVLQGGRVSLQSIWAFHTLQQWMYLQNEIQYLQSRGGPTQYI